MTKNSRTTPWLLASMTAVLIAACGGRGNDDTGAGGGTGTETGTMQGGAGTTTDTAMPTSGTTGAGQGGMNSDTTRASVRIHSDTNNPTSGAGTGASDSARGNQTKSGVTNTQTGKSTLGKGVTTTRPDQNQPVTSKGDTVGGHPDSATGAHQ